MSVFQSFVPIKRQIYTLLTEKQKVYNCNYCRTYSTPNCASQYISPVPCGVHIIAEFLTYAAKESPKPGTNKYGKGCCAGMNTTDGQGTYDTDTDTQTD